MTRYIRTFLQGSKVYEQVVKVLPGESRPSGVREPKKNIYVNI